jgi:hypothetical protein
VPVTLVRVFIIIIHGFLLKRFVKTCCHITPGNKQHAVTLFLADDRNIVLKQKQPDRPADGGE